MSYSYIVLGAGRQGVAAAYDLARFGAAARVTLADIELEPARAAADRVNRLVGDRVADAIGLDVRDEAAVLEMRGGTHVVVRPGVAAGGTAPFDLMVDDLDAAHHDYAEKGLSPSPIRQRQWRYDHDSFELPGPDGWVFTVHNSHVGELPV